MDYYDFVHSEVTINRGSDLLKKSTVAALITAGLLAGVAAPASASLLRWEDRDVDESGELTPPETLFWGLDLGGVNVGDLREQRPNSLASDEAFDTRSAAVFFLGGQEVFSTQSSSASTIASAQRDDDGLYLRDNSQSIIGVPDSRACDWQSGISGSLCFNEMIASGQQIEFHANLPVCQTIAAPQENQPCVVSVEENGTNLSYHRDVDSSLGTKWADGIGWKEGLDSGRQLTGYVLDPTWDASPELGVPAGGASSLWVRGDPDSHNEREDLGFFVRATIKGFISWEEGSPVVRLNGLDAQIVKYRLLSIEDDPVDENDWQFSELFYPPALVTLDTFNAREALTFRESFPFMGSSPMASFNNPTGSEFGSCAFEELLETVSNCGVALALDAGARYDLKLKVPESIGGWFHGRLAKANMDLTPLNESFGDEALSELTVSGNAVNVPTTGVQYAVCSDTPSVFEIAAPGFCEDDRTQGLVGLRQWSPNSPTAVSDFTTFFPLMSVGNGPTQAKGSVNLWSFGTMEDPISQFDLDDPLHCSPELQEGLQGMIATNAMVYQAGLPIPTGGSLNYQVASTKLGFDQQPVKGDYTLVMRSDLAKCVYKLGSSEITNSETIVTGEDGGEREAETTWVDDGTWLTFKAWDFGFSAPTISVYLNQTPTPSVLQPRGQSKPSSVLAPRIQSAPKVGRATTVTTGLWSNSTGTTFTYQWFRCKKEFSPTTKPPTSSECAAIPGATESSYVPKKRDSRFLLSAKVTALTGSETHSVFSATAPFGVKRLLDYAAAPFVDGVAKVGQTLMASPGEWSTRSVSTRIKWFSCSSNSALSELGKPSGCLDTKVKGKKYVANQADQGKYLVARVTARSGNQVFVYFTQAIQVTRHKN